MYLSHTGSVFSDSNQSQLSRNDPPSDSEQTSSKNVSSSSSNTGARSSNQRNKKKGMASQKGGGASGSERGDDDDNGSSQGRKEWSRPSSPTKEKEEKHNPSGKAGRCVCYFSQHSKKEGVVSK